MGQTMPKKSFADVLDMSEGLEIIDIDFRQAKFPLFLVKTCLAVLFGHVFIYR